AQKRPIASARKLDTFQHPVKAFVRTARRGPNSVKALQHFLSIRFKDGRSRNPSRFHRHIEGRRGVLQRLVSSMMGAELRIEVAQDSDADRVAHRAILIEKAAGAVEQE